MTMSSKHDTVKSLHREKQQAFTDNNAHDKDYIANQQKYHLRDSEAISNA